MQHPDGGAAQPVVLHVISTLSLGGAERMLARVLIAERPRGFATHQVAVVRPGGSYVSVLRERGIEVTELAPSGSRIVAFAVAGWRLVRLLRKVRPGLVVSWLYHADLLATAAARLAGSPPVIWNLRGSAKEQRGHRLLVRLLARLSRFPVAVAHNSHSGRRDHEDRGYRPRRWIYLPNGVDLDEWRPDARERAEVRERFGFGATDIVAVTTARVHAQKDHGTLLRAFALLGDLPSDRGRTLRLVLVGDGTEEFEVPPAIADRVVPLGARRDLQQLLRGCDIGVLSSAFGEGLPNAVVEAMATGLPCVVTDVGDAAVLVGETGRVVPPRRPDLLAASLQELVELDPDDRRALGEAARARVRTHYSIEASLEAYDRLWHDVAAPS